jgi:hypothetical protein
VKALHRLYTLGVLWVLSVVAQDAADAIYRSGHEDGMTELRGFMRRDLEKVYAATSVERMRSYHRGYRDALRQFEEDEPVAAAHVERVM